MRKSAGIIRVPRKGEMEGKNPIRLNKGVSAPENKNNKGSRSGTYTLKIKFSTQSC